KKGVKKHKISGSKIVDAVHKGVRKTPPDAKDSQLEKETKKRFVRAPEKLKPAKASSSQTSHVGDEEDSD
ncbi:Uncharacterized protein APZ42_000806, partial [Daphnia magna]